MDSSFDNSILHLQCPAYLVHVPWLTSVRMCTCRCACVQPCVHSLWHSQATAHKSSKNICICWWRMFKTTENIINRKWSTSLGNMDWAEAHQIELNKTILTSQISQSEKDQFHHGLKIYWFKYALFVNHCSSSNCKYLFYVWSADFLLFLFW